VPQVQAKNGLASQLAEARLTEATSAAPTRLGDFWTERPVVLVHLRHFGCLFCRAHLARLRDRHPEIDGQGANVVAVGTGDLDYGRQLQAQLRLTFPLLLDERLQTYAAVGAGRGHLTDWILRGVMRAGEKAALETGARHGPPGKHVSALGATHIIRPDGSVPFAWCNGDFSEDAPLERVLELLRTPVTRAG
jgi:prostamide/prostaglandin F2alpha synthase